MQHTYWKHITTGEIYAVQLDAEGTIQALHAKPIYSATKANLSQATYGVSGVSLMQRCANEFKTAYFLERKED